jgi:hypothetical protein
MSVAARDPRPLIGEPLALDLLNTRWMRDGDVAQDLLTDPERARRLARLERARRAADEATRATLTHTTSRATRCRRRWTIPARRTSTPCSRTGGSGPPSPPKGPARSPSSSDPRWGPAGSPPADYLELLSTAPDRIRRCAHEACVLHFFDTSRNGTRRWCSMAACGNRAKASRHYARSNQRNE